MKYYFPVLLILKSICAQTNYPGDDAVGKGVHAFYNYETEKAIEILTQTRNDWPNNPTVHLTWVAARWAHNQANTTVDQTYIDLENDLNEIIPLYKQLVTQFPDDYTYRLYLGSAIGLKARIYIGKKKWLKTLRGAYSGFRIIHSVAAEHPEIVDAALPIGIVEYYAGLSNVLIRWGANLLGLDPSREIGLGKIEHAANKGPWAWIEAKGILSFIYLWVDVHPEKAFEHSSDLVELFPKNFYFRILYTESLIQSGDINKALAELNTLAAMVPYLTPIQKKWYQSYLQYEWALFHFTNGNIVEAETHINIAIEDYASELDIILANAWYLKGQINDLQNNRDGALTAYAKCIELDNYSYTIQLAKIYSKSPYQN